MEAILFLDEARRVLFDVIQVVFVPFNKRDPILACCWFFVYWQLC